MKKYIFCFFVLLGSFCFAQDAFIVSKVEKKTTEGHTLERAFYRDNIEIARLYFDGEGNQVRATGNIPDGILVKSFYDNGNIEREVYYKRGKRDGIAKFYSEDGKLVKEVNLKEDEFDGLCKEYYADGTLQSESNYRNGILEGETRTYSEGGTLKTLLTIKNGKENGPAIVYYKNGNKQYEVNYIDGLFDGVLKAYYEDGTLCSIGNYKTGILQGDYNFYYPNGKLKKHLFFINGKEDVAKAQFYDDSDNIIPNIVTTALGFYQDYENNEVAADQKYRGKLVTITGQISRVKKDYSDRTYIELIGRSEFSTVDCYLADGQEDIAVKLQRGQTITIRGTGEKKSFFPQIIGCVIIQ